MSSTSFAPVLAREMRAAARHGSLYVQRMAGAMVALAFIGFLCFESGDHLTSSQMSNSVFTVLHIVILSAIWIFVPPMLADTLARERREGTLDLLFLTPLSARGNVIGKAAAGALRAFNLCLVVLPMMALPLLMGGISATNILTAGEIELSCLVLAIGAGLLASSKTRRWGGAVGWSYLYSALLFYAFCLLVAARPVFLYTAGRPDWIWMQRLLYPIIFILLPDVWATLVRVNPVSRQAYIAGLTAAQPVTITREQETQNYWEQYARGLLVIDNQHIGELLAGMAWFAFNRR